MSFTRKAMRLWDLSAAISLRPTFPALARVSAQTIRLLSWSAAISFLGLFIGIMTVILPPMAAIGFTGLLGAVLFWAMPEMRRVPLKSLRTAFLAMVVVVICVPGYYAVQVPGLPWISIRRLAIFWMVLLLLIVVSGSAKARAGVSATFLSAKPLGVCVAGFAMMCFVSLFTSASVPDSMSAFLEVLLNWYFPILGCMFVVRDERDVLLVFKLVAVTSLIVAGVGIAEFAAGRRVAVDIIPSGLLTMMMDANPSFAGMVNSSPYRNGLYRASSIFTVPLSFGEFAAMVAPLGAYFVLHRDRLIERLLGLVVMTGALLSLFVCGSRGAAMAFIIGMACFSLLWVIRYTRTHANSLFGPISAVAAVFGIIGVVGTILASTTLSNAILGGGDAAASNEARFIQWEMAKPQIFANPVTGYGLGNGAKVIGFREPSGLLTVDSSLLSITVETGVPGLLFFFGMVGFGALIGIRLYLTTLNSRGAFGGPLAASFVAFGFYRSALSARDNFTLLYIFVGLVFVLARLAQQPTADAVEGEAGSV